MLGILNVIVLTNIKNICVIYEITNKTCLPITEKIIDTARITKKSFKNDLAYLSP